MKYTFGTVWVNSADGSEPLVHFADECDAMNYANSLYNSYDSIDKRYNTIDVIKTVEGVGGRIYEESLATSIGI